MDEQGLSIQAHFANVTDPRKAWNQDHRLSDILVMALCGIICGARAIARFSARDTRSR